MIVIQETDVIAVDPEIGDVAEVGIEEIETDTEIIETIEIAETEMIIEETEMIEEIETEKDTETVAETDIEIGDNLPFGGKILNLDNFIKQSINSLHTMASRLYLASLSPLKIYLLQWTAKKFNFLNLLGGHPIYKYCVCFIVAPQQVSLLILSFLTAEKNQGTHFIITFTSKDSSALLSQTQITQ